MLLENCILKKEITLVFSAVFWLPLKHRGLHMALKKKLDPVESPGTAGYTLRSPQKRERVTGTQQLTSKPLVFCSF